MKKIFVISLIFVLLIAIIVSAIYIYPMFTTKNCKNDRVCIVDSMRNCWTAKGIAITDGSGSPSRETSVKIQGIENGRCKMSFTNQDGKEMTCLIPYEMFEGTDFGGYNNIVDPNGIQVSKLNGCVGTLKDALYSKYQEILVQNPSASPDKMELPY